MKKISEYTDYVEAWREECVILGGEKAEEIYANMLVGLYDKLIEIIRLLNASKADTAASLLRGHTVRHDLKAYAEFVEKLT